MNFPFNFINPPYFNNNFQNPPQNNNFNFFNNPFAGQPFFNNNNNPLDQQQSFNYNNFNPFQQNNNIPEPFPTNKPNLSRKHSKKSQEYTPNLNIKSSEKLKILGNECYKAGDYQKAINYYSKAIVSFVIF